MDVHIFARTKMPSPNGLLIVMASCNAMSYGGHIPAYSTEHSVSVHNIHCTVFSPRQHHHSAGKWRSTRVSKERERENSYGSNAGTPSNFVSHTLSMM